MTEALIPFDDQEISAWWRDDAATIADIPVPPGCIPDYPAGPCASCRPHFEAENLGPVPELVTITSPKWSTWDACRDCGESQLAVLHGKPVNETTHPFGVRQLAREQLWIDGYRSKNVAVIDP